MAVRALLLLPCLRWGVLAATTALVFAGAHSASKEKNVAPGSKGLLAEWQWEPWSPPSNGTRGPGPRAGAALWLDRAADCWWLFGGRQPPSLAAGAAAPPKAYSDLWRYDPAARAWTRVLSADGRRSGPKGMLLLRSSLQESDAAAGEAAAAAAEAAADAAVGAGAGTGTGTGTAAKAGSADAAAGSGGGEEGGAGGRKRIVTEPSPALLCGRADPQDPQKRSLAYYDPRNRRSNTVWQLELSDRVWTAYMCCCDRTDASAAAAAAAAVASAHADTPPERAGTLKTHAAATRPAPPVRHGVVRTHAGAAADAEEEAEEEERREERQEQEEKRKAKAEAESVRASAHAKSTHAPTSAVPVTPASTPPAPPAEHEEFPVTTPTPVTASAGDTPRPRASPHTPPGATPPRPVEAARARPSSNDSDTGMSAGSTLPPPQKPSPDKAGSKTISKPSENKSKEPPAAAPCCGGDSDSASDEDGGEGAGAGAGASVGAGAGAGESVGEKSLAGGLGSAVGAGDAEAFCPDFEAFGGSQPIAWCDSTRDQLLAMDLRAAPLSLWQFDLATSHWSRHKVGVRNDTLWPGCSSDPSAVRYASAGSSVLVLCTPYGARASTATRLVYRLEASAAPPSKSKAGGRGGGGGPAATLRALGQLQLDAALADAALWADDARSALAAAPAGDGRTLLLMAHDKVVNLWLLDETAGAPRVEAVENVWPGNSLKWFREYSAPLYNLLVEGQTWLLPNPRTVSGYWTTERGRFVVRLRQREEAARHVLEEARAAARDASSAQAHAGGAGGGGGGGAAHDGVKALIFFAFSLTIFAVFGVVVFVRRCVTCPGRRGGAAGAGGGSTWCGGRGDDAGKAAPPVIRYSVIPDDLAYPKA